MSSTSADDVISCSDAARRGWLATLVHAPREALLERAQALLAGHAFQTLREPETGLVMLRGRLDGGGNRFNLGEATMTRCVVRHGADDARSGGTLGVGYCLGRDGQRARCIAQLDALLQQPAYHVDVRRGVVEPLQTQIDSARQREAASTARTRVSFETLQPERAR